MEIYAALTKDQYDALSDTSALFWGAVILVAIVASCMLAFRAIESRRRRDKTGSRHQVVSKPRADGFDSGLGNFASMIVAGHRDSSTARRQKRRKQP